MRKFLFSLAAVSMLSFLAGCPPEVPSPPDPTKEDVDGDTYTVANGDCDDNDPAVNPGAAEICDQKDNNCNGVIDEGNVCTITKPDTGGPDGGPDGGSPDADGGQPPTPCPSAGATKPCGIHESGCKQTCEGSGTDLKWGDCKTAGGQKPETQTDINNCGQCGAVCPTPLRAAAVCKKGQCGRGPCETDYFDFDRETTFGCEVSCNGKVCTNGPNTWTLTAAPLPEKGLVFQTFASGGSFGDKIQTNASYTNMGTLGEPTPPGVGGSVESSNATHKNQGGFGAALRKQ